MRKIQFMVILTLGRPPFLPLALAACSPALVRSRIISHGMRNEMKASEWRSRKWISMESRSFWVILMKC